MMDRTSRLCLLPAGVGLALLLAGCGVNQAASAEPTTASAEDDSAEANIDLGDGADPGITTPRRRLTTIVDVHPTLVAPAPIPPPTTSPEPTTTAPPTTAPPTTAPTTPPADGLAEIGDLRYAGAFQLPSGDFGDSNVNYAVGTLAYNPAGNSLFIAGHAHHNAIAEFPIPATLGTGRTVSDLPMASSPIQPFVSVLESPPTGNPDAMDKITGLYVADGQLVVNANRWYDAGANARDTTLVIRDASDLGGGVDGYFELEGAALAAGYIAPIPAEWQGALGGSLLSGWASNYSIIGRYSVGPSLFTLEPADLLGGGAGPVETTTHMAFPHSGGNYLHPDALSTTPGSAPALWNFLSRGVYGFIIPGTRTFAVVGSNGGIDSGIGYKITQDNGNLCGGHCSYAAADNYNYYWFFDLDEIVAAGSAHTPRPYAHGRWSIPFDDGADHDIIGATFDPASRRLYLALNNGGQVGAYDRPPLIVAYDL